MTTYRQITHDDIPAIAGIARAVWDASHPAWQKLAGAYGGEILSGRLRDDHAGWAYSLEGEVVGFSIADRSTGQLLMIAVLPDHRKKRIGRELIRQAEGWLWSHGWNEIRLLMLDEGAGVESAFLTHAGWASDEGVRGVHVKKNPGVVFKLEEHSISDPDSGYSRLIRLQRGPSDRRHRLCLLLDGEIYWRDMGVMEILNGLVESGKIPGMTFAFVGCVSGPARQEDLVCNERYLRFISGRVMEWLKAEIPSLEDGGHLIGGLSLSGLMSTFIALNDPGHFGACLSQSGSHWWRHEWFNSMARGLAPVNGRFWLSVGDQETQTNLHHSPTLYQEISQIEGVGKLAATLSDAGGEVHCHRHPGGHSFLPWKEELVDALCWLTEQR